MLDAYAMSSQTAYTKIALVKDFVQLLSMFFAIENDIRLKVMSLNDLCDFSLLNR